MSKVTVSKGKKKSKKKVLGKVGGKKKEPAKKYKLPTKPTKPGGKITDYHLLLYGEPKIGKTSLFAQEKNALFLEFDPLQRAHAIHQVHIPNIRTFEGYLLTIESNCQSFETIILDGVDLLYQMVLEDVSKKNGVTHPSEAKDYGKTWSEVRQTFAGYVKRILSLPLSSRFIAHSSWRETERADGTSLERFSPTLSGIPTEVLVSQVDAVIAYRYRGMQRYLQVAGDETVSAGHRIDHAFRTPDGSPVQEIPAGSSPQEAWLNLLCAFANEQSIVQLPRKAATRKLSKKKAAKKKRL